MVAMGTSLADKAWGSDSAVYRVAGVLNVIGGWLLTALIAFIASGFIAALLYYLGQYGLYMLVIIVGVTLTKNYFTHKSRRQKELQEEKLETIESKSIKGVIYESSKNISKLINKPFNDDIHNIIQKCIKHKLRIVKKDKFDKYTDTLLYLAARNEHVKTKIKPALQKKKIVICDRFIDSTIAYQVYGKKVELDFIENIHERILHGIKPNIVFILKVSYILLYCRDDHHIYYLNKILFFKFNDFNINL